MSLVVESTLRTSRSWLHELLHTKPVNAGSGVDTTVQYTAIVGGAIRIPLSPRKQHLSSPIPDNVDEQEHVTQKPVVPYSSHLTFLEPP